jgi:DDB1- and CUL4-associated factor 12
MEVSPCGTKLAVGADFPSDLCILNARSLDTQMMCAGHTDWIFALAWVNTDLLVSGGRDGLLRVWDTRRCGSSNVHEALPVLSACATRSGHAQRVRAMTYMSASQCLASLSPDGVVRLWDPAGGLTPVGGDIMLPGVTVEDSCCLVSAGDSMNGHIATHPYTAIAGGLRLYMLDVRCPTNSEHFMQIFPAHDQRMGIRSLSLRDHLLTVGTAAGSLSFMDMRVRRYIPVAAVLPSSGASCGDEMTLHVGKGRIQQGTNHRDGLSDLQTVFHHAWDPAHRRLATVGGPIQSGLRGTYAAIWA